MSALRTFMQLRRVQLLKARAAARVERERWRATEEERKRFVQDVTEAVREVAEIKGPLQ